MAGKDKNLVEISVPTLEGPKVIHMGGHKGVALQNLVDKQGKWVDVKDVVPNAGFHHALATLDKVNTGLRDRGVGAHIVISDTMQVTLLARPQKSKLVPLYAAWSANDVLGA